MLTFGDFLNENIDESLKKEIATRNVANSINQILNDRYIEKAQSKGQRDNAVLVVLMKNGERYKFIPERII